MQSLGRALGSVSAGRTFVPGSLMPEQEELTRQIEHHILRTVTGESHRWEETARGDQHLEMARLQETHRRITAEKDGQLQRIISRSGINNWQSIRDQERMQRDHQEQLARQQQLFAELQRENADLRSVNEKLGNYHQEHDEYHWQQLQSVQ